MNIKNNKAENIKIAYIGGGSRGWAWGIMTDLGTKEDISGDVYLYDIDYEAAKNNEIIGNMFNETEDAKTHWTYHACKTQKEALENADFVVISILPGTFDEMESDVHLPEKYGIYQSVGDTSGPGGIVRAMRTVPMYEVIAEDIKKYCPNAWVINYTNPMTLCVRTLYRVFPEIKAFGCCHEVFGTQILLARAVKNICGIEEDISRDEIKVNPVSVNHFTWLTSARYKNIDVYPIYEKLVEKYADIGFTEGMHDNWANSSFECNHRVKFDLFKRFGVIAAAGDRHLAEFCEGKWYLESPEKVKGWGFGLTTVAWRKNDLKERLQKMSDYANKVKPVDFKPTGEEGVNQMRAILGLNTLVSNVNLPNRGQIPNLPLGAVVETNAVFGAGTVTPVMAGEIPQSIYPLVSRVCGEQEALNDAIARRDVHDILTIFQNDPLVTCSLSDAKKLFREMCENTKKYLTSYDLSVLDD